MNLASSKKFENFLDLQNSHIMSISQMAKSAKQSPNVVTILSLQVTVAANVFIKDSSANQIFLNWQSLLTSPPQKISDFVWHREPPCTAPNTCGFILGGGRWQWT